MEGKNINDLICRSLILYIKYRRFKKITIMTKQITDNLLCAITPQNNINMFDEKKNVELQYDKFCKMIQDKNLIKIMSHFLETYYDYYKLDENIAKIVSAKKLLFMWLLIGFPQFTISKTHHELITQSKNIYPNEIYHISTNLLKCLSDLNSSNEYKKSNNDNLRKFTKALNQYSNAITYFLERDKMEEISKLVQEYYDINETLMRIRVSDNHSEEMKKEDENLLNKSKEKILTYINKFDKSIKKEDLESYANLNLIKSLKIEQAQFQIMLNDIRIKKLFYFKRAIDFIKSELINLKALKTKNGYNLNEILDSDFMVQKIVVSNLFGYEDVVKYGNYIFAILSELQSQDSMEKSKIKWEIMKADHMDKQMYVFLCNMIFFVMKEINTIHEELNLLSTMSNLGILI